MGTSQTYGGPGDRPALLPSWATPPQPATPNVVEPVIPQLDGQQPETGNPPNPDELPSVSPDAGNPSLPVSAKKISRPWQAAKSSFTKYASGGGGRTGITKAAKSYVRARGGSRSAAAAAAGGKRTLANVGQFFSSVARSGWNAALQAIGLQSAVGRSADIMCAAIINAIAPEGATLEDAVARKAMCDVFDVILADKLSDTADGEFLDTMSADDVRAATTDFVSLYVYYKWIEELGKSIEKGTVSERESVKLEREVKQFVRDVVQLRTDGIDVLSINWKDSSGQGIIDDVFQQAYSLLEDAE